MSQTKAQLIDNLVQALNFTGTASAPANGAFLSAANTLALATNSAQRLTIDSSGRLLIGTTSSRSSAGIQTKLQIEGTDEPTSSLSLIRNTANTNAPRLIFGKTRGSSLGTNVVVQNNDVLGNIAFVGNDGTDLASFAANIAAFVDGTPGSNDMPGRLVFSTTADGADSPTERMRITSSGSVGIDTTSPITKFDVNGDIRATTHMYVGDSIFHVGDTNTKIRFPAEDTFTVETAGSERMRIDSSGRLLIGRTSGDFPLDVNGAARIAGIFYMANDQRIQWGGSNVSFIEGNDESHILFGVAAEKMRLTATGLGIGTTSPDSKLHISAISATAQLRLTRSNAAGNTNDYGRILWESQDDVLTGKIAVARQSAENNGYMHFSTANGGTLSERMRITATGTVGIATSSPDSNFVLDVNGVMRIGDGNNGRRIQFSRSGLGDQLVLGVDGTGVGNVNDAVIQSSPSFPCPLIFGTNNAERLRITSGGDLVLNSDTARVYNGHTPKLSIQGTNFSQSTLAITSNSNGTDGAYLFFAKQRSGSVGGSTAPSNGDIVGQLRYVAGDGTDTESEVANITVNIDGTPGSNDTPGRITFATTNDGGNTSTERYRITNTGNLGWRNQAIFQRKHYFFVGQSANTVLDTKISEDFGNGDMARVQYSYMWNDGDGGAWGTAIVWKHHDGNVEIRKLGEEIASPAEDLTFVVSGNDLFIRFDLVSNAGMNGYAYLSVECGGCTPFSF